MKLTVKTDLSIKNTLFAVFVCASFGFVEFARRDFVEAIVSWQDANLGCYKNKKPADSVGIIYCCCCYIFLYSFLFFISVIFGAEYDWFSPLST